jgi:hypothetical protein
MGFVTFAGDYLTLSGTPKKKLLLKGGFFAKSPLSA